jgi:hypothetical protein
MKCRIKVKMSTREIVLELAQKLPPDATLDDTNREPEFRQAFEDCSAAKESELVRG